MESSSTRYIVESLSRAIVEHRLHPGTKLAEQKLADHFGVSRTLVRRALPRNPALAVPVAGSAGLVLPGCECASVPIAGGEASTR